MRSNSLGALEALEQIELRRDCSLADIRAWGSPPIAALVRPGGDKRECYLLIEAMLILLNQYFGITWSEYQLTETSKEFYGKFYYWHQLDLKMFFKMCRSMEFGKLLSVNQFTPPIFLGWAEVYDSRWIKLSEEMRLAEHDKYTHDADRSHQVYMREVTLKAEREQDKDRAERLSYVVDKQREEIERLKNQKDGK